MAVKVLQPTSEASSSQLEDFQREVRLLRACKDPNIGRRIRRDRMGGQVCGCTAVPLRSRPASWLAAHGGGSSCADAQLGTACVAGLYSARSTRGAAKQCPLPLPCYAVSFLGASLANEFTMLVTGRGLVEVVRVPSVCLALLLASGPSWALHNALGNCQH